VTELGIVAKVRAGQGAKQVVLAGSRWTDRRKLRALRWIGGKYPGQFTVPGHEISQQEFQKTFQEEINRSVQREARDAKRKP
jgi:hypothetical protein